MFLSRSHCLLFVFLFIPSLSPRPLLSSMSAAYDSCSFTETPGGTEGEYNTLELCGCVCTRQLCFVSGDVSHICIVNVCVWGGGSRAKRAVYSWLRGSLWLHLDTDTHTCTHTFPQDDSTGCYAESLVIALWRTSQHGHSRLHVSAQC